MTDNVTDDYLYEEEEEARQEGLQDLPPEPLFAAMLRHAVHKLWPGDRVMVDFVDQVAGPLSDRLAGIGAKGGEWVAEREAAGRKVEQRYAADQSQRAHLINGLFPVLNVARILQRWGAPQFRHYDEATRRLFIAGYVLHDYIKLPGVREELAAAGLDPDAAVSAQQLPRLEDVFRHWCDALGLDAFLASLGGVGEVLQDVIYVACNTQVRWGTLGNLSLLDRLTLGPAQLDLAEQLSRLADLLAYTARTPQGAAGHRTIHSVLTTLSNGLARLTYHHLADNRGVLTNLIHNGALRLVADEYRVPLLYAPSGVVYLEHKTEAPPMPSVEEVTEETMGRIRDMVRAELWRTRSGIKRDGKGLKYAEFYWLFFDLPAFIRLGVQATFDVIREGKKPSAGKRFAKMQDKGWMEPEVDLDLPDTLQVDQLAEWCYLAQKQVAADLPAMDVEVVLLEVMGLADLGEQFRAVPRDNRAGGVGYHWYFAAGHYAKRHPGLDPAAWRERVESFAGRLARAVAEEPAPHEGEEGRTDWDDFRDYVGQVLTVGDAAAARGRDTFAAELERYTNAKRRGRGTTQMCALCSSPYRVDKQREAAVLFAPQVYSNKQPLHGSDALRSICSICSLEMMLRQNLMNRSAATGGAFEGRRVRYLFFYPTYFFTPETLAVFNRVYVSLCRPSFTEFRRQVVGATGKVDLSAERLQRLEALLLEPEEEYDPAGDRYVRFHFPETDPVTFYFLGVPPPGRDVKDAEAWVHPAFLALLLPLCLDVKVVASEASIPLLVEAGEIDETVFLDAPHAAIRYLTGGRERVNVDQVLPTLQRLAVGYLIHMDGNSGMGRGGYDYRWQQLPALARDLDSSPLYAFHYLKKWQRQQRFDTLPRSKVRQYIDYVTNYLEGGEEMSHARELTTCYRRFYRASSFSAYNVLRPLSIAADVVLDADPRLFGDEESLVEAVYADLHARIENTGDRRSFYFPKGSKRPDREEAMRAFAGYFVREIFYEGLRGDKSALRGRQLNLLKNACEAVYHQLEEKERTTRAEAAAGEESDE